MMHLACWSMEENVIPEIIKIRMQNGKGLLGFKGSKYKRGSYIFLNNNDFINNSIN